MPEFIEPLWLLALPMVVALAVVRMRQTGAVRQRVGHGVRVLVLGLVVVALAGPLGRSSATGTDVIFLVDVSRSVPSSAVDEALGFINRAIARAPQSVRHSVVVFGADAAMERGLQAGAMPLAALDVTVEREGTDIGRAIELAASAFSDAGARRIVLLSDGRDNRGRLDSAVAMARSLGIGIYTVPLDAGGLADEVRVHGLTLPAEVRADEPFAARLTIDAANAGDAEVVLAHNGVVVDELRVSLAAGRNTFSLPQQVTDSGLHEFEIIVNRASDAVQENNRYQAFVRVRGEPRVLHVIGQPGEGDVFTAALRTQGLQVDELPASAMPQALNALVDYDVVMLNDVSGFDLSLGKMETLERYVRDAGGGLVMLGGPRSFAAGGYFATPIERTLPVDMDVRTEVKIPSLAVIVLLDKSGSMATVSGGKEKLEIAKRAALAAVEVLNPLDRVGVLAFDAGFEWVVPPTEVGNRRAIAVRLRGLESGGGTDLLIGLAEAHRLMTQQPARVKHLILLSDGLSDNGADHDGLLNRIVEDGITVSTVAFGTDADRALMERIAAIGKGRHYYSADINNVPRIFTSETMVVARSLVVEGRFSPRMTYPGEILDGFEDTGLPPVDGYQRTWPKAAAQVLVESTEGDPLLVAWRYGLGRSVALTTDLNGRWSRDWLGWKDFSRFAGQMTRWAMRRAGTEQMSARFTWTGEEARVVVDALDGDDRFINGLDLSAALTSDGSGERRVPLAQVAPGRYEARFPVSGPGRYFASVAARGDDTLAPRTFGFAIPYSPEYASAGLDRDALTRIALGSGGAVLPMSPTSEAVAMTPDPEAVPRGEPVWWPLLLAALVLLVLEVAVRRLTVPGWLRRLAPRSAANEAPDEPGYEALVEGIRKSRESHIADLRDGLYYRPDDPAIRARLYYGERGVTRARGEAR